MAPLETPEHHGEHRKMREFRGGFGRPVGGLNGVEADALSPDHMIAAAGSSASV